MRRLSALVCWCLIIFATNRDCCGTEFNSSGPYSFNYLLGETKNFNTKASVIFLDYEISAKVITDLRKSKTVICYVSVGSFEDWRPDASKFPKSVIGKNYSGWSGEKWLDVREVNVLLPIMEARFDQAAKKGCEGIDPDNMDVYTNDSGFKITKAQQITYNKAILDSIKKRKMMAGIKNAGAQAKELVSRADFAVSEECVQYKECSKFDIFIKAKPKSKPVFVVEYTGHWSASNFRKTVCPMVKTTGMSYILKKLNLKNDYTVSCL